MSDLFPNQDFGRPIYKHVSLPIYVTDEFVFIVVWSLTIRFIIKLPVNCLMEI